MLASIAPYSRHLWLLLATLFAFSGTHASIIPSPPSVAASGYILIDASTGQTLVAKNADEQLPPASLTKLMSAYVVENEIQSDNISLNDLVNVSVKAWKMGGSRMFIREGTVVKLEDLLRGVIIQSGNDATVALAEHVAGSEDAFVDLMNQHADRLGLTSSHFMNSTGWPADNHYVTARDMAILAAAIIKDFPSLYSMYSEKEFTYNGITQQNRNLLLWRDPSVDGLKTGHTEEAGYCLVSSAKKNNMRLIAVVMGTDSKQARAVESQKLLNYGFRFFETYHAYDAGDLLNTAEVWMGTQKTLNLGTADNVSMTIPRDSHGDLKAEMQINKDLRAPIFAGQQYGMLTISLEGETLLEQPLVALNNIEEAGLFTRIWHHIVLFFKGLF